MRMQMMAKEHEGKKRSEREKKERKRLKKKELTSPSLLSTPNPRQCDPARRAAVKTPLQSEASLRNRLRGFGPHAASLATQASG